MDVSRTFDNVHHDLLLRKLQVMGFRGVVRDLREAYLADSRQCLAAYNLIRTQITYTLTKNLYGVLQGSSLGPLLLLLYIRQ